MAKVTKKLARACQLLRGCVMLHSLRIQLPETSFPGDDTDKIREALRIAFDSHVLPLIDAIERGDIKDWQVDRPEAYGLPIGAAWPKYQGATADGRTL